MIEKLLEEYKHYCEEGTKLMNMENSFFTMFIALGLIFSSSDNLISKIEIFSKITDIIKFGCITSIATMFVGFAVTDFFIGKNDKRKQNIKNQIEKNHQNKKTTLKIKIMDEISKISSQSKVYERNKILMMIQAILIIIGAGELFINPSILNYILMGVYSVLTGLYGYQVISLNKKLKEHIQSRDDAIYELHALQESERKKDVVQQMEAITEQHRVLPASDFRERWDEEALHGTYQSQTPQGYQDGYTDEIDFSSLKSSGRGGVAKVRSNE